MSELEPHVEAEKAEIAKLEVPRLIYVNGKPLETDKAEPLSLGDQRKLKKKGANLRELSKTGDPDVLAELLYLFCAKMNPDITMDDIDTLTNKQLALLSKLVSDVEQGDVDRPT